MSLIMAPPGIVDGRAGWVELGRLIPDIGLLSFDRLVS